MSVLCARGIMFEAPPNERHYPHPKRPHLLIFRRVCARDIMFLDVEFRSFKSFLRVGKAV